jgi:hypothetical protein
MSLPQELAGFATKERRPITALVSLIGLYNCDIRGRCGAIEVEVWQNSEGTRKGQGWGDGARLPNVKSEAIKQNWITGSRDGREARDPTREGQGVDEARGK